MLLDIDFQTMSQYSLRDRSSPPTGRELQKRAHGAAIGKVVAETLESGRPGRLIKVGNPVGAALDGQLQIGWLR